MINLRESFDKSPSSLIFWVLFFKPWVALAESHQTFAYQLLIFSNTQDMPLAICGPAEAKDLRRKKIFIRSMNIKSWALGKVEVEGWVRLGLWYNYS